MAAATAAHSRKQVHPAQYEAGLWQQARGQTGWALLFWLFYVKSNFTCFIRKTRRRTVPK